MNRVKVFTFEDHGSSEVEGEINAWLQQNPDIVILDRTQTQSGGNSGGYRMTDLTVTIWYEEA